MSHVITSLGVVLETRVKFLICKVQGHTGDEMTFATSPSEFPQWNQGRDWIGNKAKVEEIQDVCYRSTHLRMSIDSLTFVFTSAASDPREELPLSDVLRGWVLPSGWSICMSGGPWEIKASCDKTFILNSGRWVCPDRLYLPAVQKPYIVRSTHMHDVADKVPVAEM